MTGAPSNEFQLLALLAFILPGVVHEAVLSRFRGPSPHQRDTSSRLLGALAVSTLLTIVYIAIFGFYLSDVLIRAQSSRGLVWREWLLLSGIAAAVLFIVPAVTAVARHVFVAYRLARKPQREDQGKRKSVFALYDATPTAWDHGTAARIGDT